VFGSFFKQSAFASMAIASEENVVKVNCDGGEAIPLRVLAPLGCGFQTGSGAVMNSLNPFPGSRIAVLGCGSVGLSAIMAAKIVGCGDIIGVDRNSKRLDLASELGATRISTQIEEIQDLDYVIDTTGIPSVFQSGFLKLLPGGTAVLLGGSAPGASVELPMLNILLGRTARGVIQGDSVSKLHIPKLIEFYKQGKFPFDKLLGFYDSLDHINEAMHDSESGRVVKPVINLL
jgi:aryl-alcohol dehydrogenase